MRNDLPACCRAHGDDVEVDGEVVRIDRCSLLDDLALSPEGFDAWNGLWEGLAAMEGRALVLAQRRDRGDDCYLSQRHFAMNSSTSAFGA